ncbi:MAG: hypothetical protein GY702_10225 [Desulfobulbaceae bacterium]|nr:hypothetical protein [Desulfobulbaceae bacterium]
MKTLSDIQAARNVMIDFLSFTRVIIVDEALLYQDQIEEAFNHNTERQLQAVIRLLSNLNPDDY